MAEKKILYFTLEKFETRVARYEFRGALRKKD
jgi:hypothetical protein